MKRWTLAVGPAFFVLSLLLPAPGSLSNAGWHVAGLAAWMATWWLTGVLPLPVTSLLPIAVLPLAGAGTIRDVTASYADPIIFLFFGGFLMAASLERWNLHRRIAFATIRLVGTDARMVVLAFLLSSGFVSMWISNTAAAVMMFPIAAALCPKAGSDGIMSDGFSKAVLLAVAYGASIGGVATLIGTPPNAIMAGAVREFLSREIDFGRWLAIGFSVAIPLMLACWILLTVLFRVRGSISGLDALAAEGGGGGREPMVAGERFVTGVFVLTALAWVLRAPKHFGGVAIPGLSDLVGGLSDAGIAMSAALLLFAWPLPRGSAHSTALDWRTAVKIPWGVLLLFGGGLALASAFKTSGLTDSLAHVLSGLQGVPLPLVVLATAALFVFLTELTSNTATAALSMPLMVSVGQGLAVDPYPLMVTAALAASMAFMLPVATPPNAVVFGSGLIRQGDMAKAGIFLNVLSILIITLVVSLLVH